MEAAQAKGLSVTEQDDLVERVLAAQQEYDSSPGGIAALTNAMPTAAATMDPSQYREHAKRLQIGIARRLRENDARLEREGREPQGYITLGTGSARQRVVAAHPLPYSTAARLVEQSEAERDRKIAKGRNVIPQAGVPVLYERHPSDASAFRSGLVAGKESSRYGAAVYVYDEAEYREEMRMFSTPDGRAGVAVHGDDIVSVYSTPPPTHSNTVGPLIATAVTQGGRRCDCFDTNLPHLYAAEGMVPVARVRWDDQYAPEGWDKETFARFNGGEPDVVFMRYDPDAVGSEYQQDQDRDVFDDYDAAAAHTQQQVVEHEPQVRAALRKAR